MNRLLKAQIEQDVDVARRIDIIEQELCSLEPQRLDTYVLQDLVWVDRQIESAGLVRFDAFGLAIMRPSAPLKLYERSWQAMDEWLMRRSDTQQ